MFVIKWMSKRTYLRGQGKTKFPRVKALSICNELNNRHPDILHYIDEDR